MSGRTTRNAPPEVAPGHDPDRLTVGLGIGVDGRVGADERGVDGAGEERLNGFRPGVERLRLERDLLAEAAFEDAGADADQRGAWVMFGK